MIERQATRTVACQINGAMATLAPMKWLLVTALFLSLAVAPLVSAQTFASPADNSSNAAQLEALAKKIDAQNAKIDALSQQILKLQQEITEKRPGVIIGETPVAPSASAAPAEAASHPTGTNSHTVARGETLTSIAKMYKVTVEDLQRVNHIEDGRRLQAGQTIAIPSAAVQPPAPSPAPSE
jgi:peptidoglycan endopeptidase LytE